MAVAVPVADDGERAASRRTELHLDGRRAILEGAGQIEDRLGRIEEADAVPADAVPVAGDRDQAGDRGAEGEGDVEARSSQRILQAERPGGRIVEADGGLAVAVPVAGDRQRMREGESTVRITSAPPPEDSFLSRKVEVAGS